MFIATQRREKARAPTERNIVTEGLPQQFRASGAARTSSNLCDYKHFVPPGLRLALLN